MHGPGNSTAEQRLRRALIALEKMQSRVQELESAGTELIAIVGMGTRMPGGADSPAAFWKILKDGIDATSEVPPDRWDVDAYYDPDPDAPGKMYTRRGAFVGNLREFDAHFFRVSPREARSLDPQQRLALEVSWEALEDAGIAPDGLAGSLAGVFLGIASTEYFQHLERSGHDRNDIYLGTGNTHSAAAGRLSFFFGLQGPSVAIDVACASSLVSVHLACQSLRNRECHLALAGGVNRIVVPEVSVHFSKVHALSPDGRSKTFDASADGYGRGEGCGFVVLKRLSDALAHGDRIRAVILGSAVNHDGASSGLTVPNGQAQQEVLRQALKHARVRPELVGYVEAHGTGTRLGDPIEAHALQAVYGKGRASPLLIGSVKTNIGHLEPASGIAGLIKTVLALEHGEIPPHLHVSEPNPHIPWHENALKVPLRGMLWPEGERIAGVSAFGINGTNVHMIVRAFDHEAAGGSMSAAPAAGADRPLHVLALSAKTEKALHDLIDRYRTSIEAGPQEDFASLCFTANAGRSHFPHRAAIVADSAAAALEQLRGPNLARARADGAPRIAFLFSGQGAQYIGMGRELYETQPAFRGIVDQCDLILREEMGRSIVSLLFGPEQDDTLLRQTANTQPALFVLGYALARLWQSWGVEPVALIGHSIGEYAAACIAGVFSIENALKLVAARGRLINSLPAGGGMFVVLASEADVCRVLHAHAGDISIAAVNGPTNTVIAGRNDALDRSAAALKAAGFVGKRLNVSHAFHSSLMEPILAEFRRVASQIAFALPKLAFVSSVSGTVLSNEMATPEYWVRQLREPVRFGGGIEALSRQGIDVLLEVGPATTLLEMSCQLPWESRPAFLASIIPGKFNWQTVLHSLKELYLRGCPIDWRSFDGGYTRRRVSLPTYPFQRQTFWIERDSGQTAGSQVPVAAMPADAHPLLGRRVHLPPSHGHVFESHLSTQSPAYLDDHRVNGAAIAPGASFLEMAAAAGAVLGGSWQIEDVAFEQPLVLGTDATLVQTALTGETGGSVSFQVLSCRGDVEPVWTRHAAGTLKALTDPPGKTDLSLGALGDRRDEISPAEFHAACRARGVDYGSAFQGLVGLWRLDDGVLAHARLPAGQAAQRRHHFHPALLDACLQPLGIFLAANEENSPWVPLGVGRFAVLHRPDGEAWSFVRARPDTSGSPELRVDAWIFLPDGKLAAFVEDLRVSRLAARTAQKPVLDDWLYEVKWREQPIDPVPLQPTIGGKRSWVVLADAGGIGERLAAELAKRGDRCAIVSKGTDYRSENCERFQVRPRQAGDWSRLFASLASVDSSDELGVVYLWSVDQSGQTRPGDVGMISRDAASEVLHLVQSLVEVRRRKPLKLWITTRGSVALHADIGTGALVGSVLWGIGKVAALEHPEFGCALVDLDAKDGDLAAALLGELNCASPGEQVVLRNGARFVGRLARSETAPAAGPARGGAYALAISSRGTPDNLHFTGLTPREPGPEHVQVEVKASALNFADVMDALGLLPFQRSTFGVEFAGTIGKVGPGVTGFKTGDRVFGAAASSFNSHVITPVSRVRLIPEGLDFVDAATLTVAFATAWYALHRVAGIKRGERVLIHSAAGGVGLAAVQLAQAAGAEIFATAHPSKWQFLNGLGIRHVMNSRTADFADGIFAATAGEGVDVVLNSLNGDAIPKSISVLRSGGRFVEIGKSDVWSAGRVAAIKPDVRYDVLDLLPIFAAADDRCIAPILDPLLELFAERRLQPLPRTVFPIEQVVDAFRYMQQARHVGKVVLVHPDRPAKRPAAGAAAIREDGSYLVTGGLGGLGLVAAQWLAARGARHVVLMGRHEPGAAAAEKILQIEAGGTQVVVVRGDVARREDVAKVLAGLKRSLPTLRGVIHTAAVIDDAVIINQSAERIDRAFAPKVDGAWHLHELTEGLDLFILFSAGASLLGSSGQANYVAANAFLDSLAHFRRQRGLPAIAINWGPWSRVGIAAARGLDERAVEMGIGSIEPNQGMEILDRLLASNPVQVGVLPIQWSKAARHFAEWPFVSEFGHVTTQRTATSDLRGTLEGLSTEEKRARIAQQVRSEMAAVLGVANINDIDLQQGFFDLGMDSLTALELRKKLQDALGCTLQPTLMFDYPTPARLINFVIRQMMPASEPQADVEQPADRDVSELLDEVEQLSDADALASLRKKDAADAP